MKRRTFVSTAGATLVGVALAGCGDEGAGADTDDGDGTATGTEGVDGTATGTEGDGELDLDGVDANVGDTPDNIEVVDSRLVETADGAAVIVTVENEGESTYEVLEAEVTLNDGDTVIGEWVDTSEEEIDQLAAGERWRFMATFEGEEVHRTTGYTIELEGDVA